MDEDQENKQKHLRLVVNNEPAFRVKTPLERLREEHQSTLKKKEEGHNETVENLRQKHTKVLKHHKLYLRIGSMALGAVTVAGLYASKYTWNTAPVEIVQLDEDLNKDGIDDAYFLQQDGHKVPMYGMRLNGNIIIYKSAEGMKRMRNDIIDYQSIEDKLNEHNHSHEDR